MEIKPTPELDIDIFIKIGDTNVYITLMFEEDTRQFMEAIVNVFQNKKQVLNYFGTLEDVFAKLKLYFQSNLIEGIVARTLDHNFSAKINPEYDSKK